MDKEEEVHIYHGILLSYKKEKNLAICNNIDGTRGYCTEWSKSDRERQMLYDFTYMWNLKSKINKQKRNKHIDTENILRATR